METKRKRRYFSEGRWVKGRGKCPFCNKRPLNTERFEHIMIAHENEAMEDFKNGTDQ